MTVVIDGNDGTGKSTLSKALRELGYEVKDRGLPTLLTDDPGAGQAKDDEVYLILDLPVEECRKRLALAGKDLNEKYHTKADLIHYRQRFMEVAEKLNRCQLIDASGSPAETKERAVTALAALLS